LLADKHNRNATLTIDQPHRRIYRKFSYGCGIVGLKHLKLFT